MTNEIYRVAINRDKGHLLMISSSVHSIFWREVAGEFYVDLGFQKGKIALSEAVQRGLILLVKNLVEETREE